MNEKNEGRALLIEIQEAQYLATQHGMTLEVIDLNSRHFRLVRDGLTPDSFLWCIDLWPTHNGQQRVFHDPEAQGPRLVLTREWGILQAVHAAIRAESDAADPRSATVRTPRRRRW